MKGLLSYISALCAAYLYMLYLDEESGLIIFFALIAAALISLILTMISAKFTKIVLEVPNNSVYSGESVKLKIHITKPKFMLSPQIFAKIKTGANFDFEGGSGEISIGQGFKENHVESIFLFAKYATAGNVGLENVRMTDFLGIFSIKLRIQNSETEISVVPKIAQSGRCNALFDSFSSNLSYDDEREASSNMFSLHATPGYDHRAYQSGDPIKRINWKLSSKKGELMIRLDEAMSASNPVFIIDLDAKNEAKAIIGEKNQAQKSALTNLLYNKAQGIIENVLGTIDLFCKRGVNCTVYLKGCREAFTVENSDDVKKLAVEIGKVNLLNAKSCLDLTEVFSKLENEANIVYCTISQSETCGEFLRLCESKSANSAVIAPIDTIMQNCMRAGLYYYDAGGNLRLK